MSEKANSNPREGTVRELGDILVEPQDIGAPFIQTDGAGGVQIKITRGNGSVEEWHVLPEPGMKFNAYNVIGEKLMFQFIPV